MKEKLQCDNCGGILEQERHDIFACKYCGMKYRITGWEREEMPVVKIVTNHSKYNIIGFFYVFSRYEDKKNTYNKNVLREIRRLSVKGD